jgi:hypothetical protein
MMGTSAAGIVFYRSSLRKGKGSDTETSSNLFLTNRRNPDNRWPDCNRGLPR